MQSNSEVLNQSSFDSAEISSLVGMNHPAKRGSPGKLRSAMVDGLAGHQ
jgi:hypothetical protein